MSNLENKIDTTNFTKKELEVFSLFLRKEDFKSKSCKDCYSCSDYGCSSADYGCRDCQSCQCNSCSGGD